jgi:hypothetical protein
MTAIIGWLVCSANLELLLDGIVLMAKYDGCVIVSMMRLVGSADV